MKKGLRELRGAQKQGESMVCEISQPKKGPCENGPWLRNNFAAPRLCCEIAISQPHTPLCENFRSCETPLWHTSAISQTPPHFGAAKCSTKSSTPKTPIFAAAPPFRSPPPSFCSCKMVCENASPLRNPPLAAKLTIRCEKEKRPFASFLNVINSSFHF